ncbi:MAG: hypothetical protein ACLSB9_03890 [Hydrogeniiclostridium mannosilyticum]
MKLPFAVGTLQKEIERLNQRRMSSTAGLELRAQKEQSDAHEKIGHDWPAWRAAQ